jgi:hypothetical protein
MGLFILPTRSDTGREELGYCRTVVVRVPIKHSSFALRSASMPQVQRTNDFLDKLTLGTACILAVNGYVNGNKQP